jgi:hypothetical protein
MEARKHTPWIEEDSRRENLPRSLSLVVTNLAYLAAARSTSQSPEPSMPALP